MTTTGPIITISGSREFDDVKIVDQIMAFLLLHGAHLRVGDAQSGVDRFAIEVWQGAPWTDRFAYDRVQFYRAEWRQMGNRAGHVRNGWMIKGRTKRNGIDGGELREQPSDGLVAIFAPGPKSVAPKRGTMDALAQAHEIGIPAMVYHEGWDIDTMPAFMAMLKVNT